MKRLVVNADDFGLSPGVDRGILECVRAGVVTSVSVLVWDRNPPSIPEELRGKCGVHLRLDGGPLLAGTLRTPMIEFEEQIKCFAAAVDPTHFDTHHHVHRPGEMGAYAYEKQCALSHVTGIGLTPEQTARMRRRRPDVACADYAELRWSDFRPLPGLLTEDFEHHETVHLMCHPGYVDDVLRARSTMLERREREMAYLLSAEFREFLEREKVELIGMAEL